MPRSRIILAVTAGVLLATAGCQKLAFRKTPEQTAEAHYQRGQILLDRGDLDAALDELAQAIAAQPDHAQAQTAIGDVYRKKGDHPLAATHYELACKADPYAFKPHYNLGVTYQVLADAARDAAEAGKYLGKAVAVYIRCLAIRPESFDSQLNLGACYYQLGKMKLAEDHTRNALTLNPRSTQACNNLAFIYEDMKDPARAILMFKRSLELEASQPDIVMRLGLNYLQNGKPALALSTYRAARKQLPDSPRPWTQIGVCQFRLKRFDVALSAFQNALRREKTYAPAYRGIGVVCIYHYVIDNSRTDLLRKGLLAWDYCLQLQPEQDDLRELRDRYRQLARRQGIEAPTASTQRPHAASWTPSPAPQSKPKPPQPRRTRPAEQPPRPQPDPLAAPPEPKVAQTPPAPKGSPRPAVRNTSSPQSSLANPGPRIELTEDFGHEPDEIVRPRVEKRIEPTVRPRLQPTSAKQPPVALPADGPRPVAVTTDRGGQPQPAAVAGPAPLGKPLETPRQADLNGITVPARPGKPVRTTRPPAKPKPRVLWTEPPPLSEALSKSNGR